MRRPKLTPGEIDYLYVLRLFDELAPRWPDERSFDRAWRITGYIDQLEPEQEAALVEAIANGDPDRIIDLIETFELHMLN